MRCSNCQNLGALLLVLSMASISAAQWTLIDNFQSSTVGSLGSQGGWTSVGVANPYTVALDPLVNTNKVLNVSSGDQAVNAYIPLGSGITVGNTGTVFFRMRNGIPGDLVFGASDLASPAGFGDYESYMIMASNQFRVRDAATNKNVGTYVANDWYNVWLVMDNNSNQSSLYASQGTDPAALLGTGAFRTGNGDPSGALVTLNVRPGAAQQGVIGYIDDIYATLNATNLTMPPGVTPIVNGDVNGDLVVNAADYEIIRTNFRNSGVVRTQGDLNGDGRVDFTDFAEWQSNAPAQAVAAVKSSSVPEPTSIAILGLGVLMLGGKRIRRG